MRLRKYYAYYLPKHDHILPSDKENASLDIGVQISCEDALNSVL